jgi:predicted ATPase
MVFLVSVTHQASQRVEHFILKLDRKSKTSRSDETSRHSIVQSKSPAKFARDHLATLAFERVELDGAIAIFYSIAGQSLQAFRPLSHFSQQHQLETIFTATNHFLMEEWNANATFAAFPPQELLRKWLGFRLEAGAPIENFIRENCRLDPERPGFLIQGGVFPNPLWYARHQEAWGNARSIDAILGLQHGDLNTNNILIKFLEDEKTLAGYYLIDFALFKEDMPLLYDLRYLEMSYLILALSQVSLARVIDLTFHLAEGNRLDLSRAPVETAGMSAVISIARAAFERWIRKYHPSLEDDLWGQYWLAGVAAGLAYCHKSGQADEPRLAGLIYAAANLKRYAEAFSIPLPTDVELLYREGQFGLASQGKPLAKKTQHNLPIQATPFIGRTVQIAALKELILNPDIRLVTLLGPGGTGKTRLSLQVAQELLENFSQGIFFVPLADDRDANQFISRLAQHLEVREGGRPLLDNVKDYLHDKCLLLILDNFEQLVSAASVVAEFLASSSQLKILVSSRIALRLSGEHEYLVPPFDLPQTTNEFTMEDLAGNEAIHFFVERARASHPNFALTKDNASAVAEICHRLDGLPLALELAAARVKLLPPQALLSRLDDRLKLLTGGARDLPSRQQTLRNTLEWSYSLLNEEEKLLYARLSVFVGGFTLEAAEAVCNAEKKLDILEGLASLVDNSLLRQEEPSEGEPRFGMLETIRAYAIERLAESGEMESLQASHAAYFGDVIHNQVGFRLYTDQALHWLNWLERENDNVRATLRWCLTTPQGFELAPKLMLDLVWFWFRRGHFIEGRMWAEKALAVPEIQAASLPRAWVLMTGGMMALWKGEQETALAQLQEGLEIEQRLEDEEWIPFALMSNAVALINMGRDRAAQPLLVQARSLFKEQNRIPFLSITTIHLGNVELGLGNPEQARVLHEEALAIARSVGDSWLVTFALNNLGEVARTQGQYDLARKYYEECEELLRETGDTGDMARFVHTLGYIAQHEGDYVRAESQFRESLKMFRQLGNRRGMAECMAGLAGLKARQGNPEWGAIMLSAAESVLKATGGAWWPADRVEVEANQEIIRSALTETELDAAQKKGRAMTLEQALVFASESK